MAAPKVKPSEYAKLFQKDSDDKKLIEALRQRLNEKLADPKNAKKAALILETWLNQKR